MSLFATQLPNRPVSFKANCATIQRRGNFCQFPTQNSPPFLFTLTVD